MKRISTNSITAFALALALVGCTKESTTTPKPEGGGQVHGEGPMTDLGSIKLGAQDVKVAQEGEVQPGKDFGVDLTWAEGQKVPPVVRAWVGDQSATGALKAKLAKESATVRHGHVEVADPFPADGMLWIEAEQEDGVLVQASIKLHR